MAPAQNARRRSTDLTYRTAEELELCWSNWAWPESTMLRFRVMWVLAMVTTALEAQPDAASMSAQDSTALQVSEPPFGLPAFGVGSNRNRQIWKVPLVWGGMGTPLGPHGTTHVRCVPGRRPYCIDGRHPTTQTVLTDENDAFSEGQLEDRAFFYRRNRDLSIWFLSPTDCKCSTPTPVPCSATSTPPTNSRCAEVRCGYPFTSMEFQSP